MKIYFATHATSIDNEKGIASGHNDPELSQLGKQQASTLPSKLTDVNFDVVYCSGLKRSIDTAKIGFEGKKEIISDARLDEIDYGDFDGADNKFVEAQKLEYVKKPFPNGESYEWRLGMMEEFLNEVKEKHSDKNILIIGSRATQYSLDSLLKGMKLEDAVAIPLKWQPYWEYEMIL